jgi:NADPH-dependent ferric siderophore reductase
VRKRGDELLVDVGYHVYFLVHDDSAIPEILAYLSHYEATQSIDMALFRTAIDCKHLR